MSSKLFLSILSLFLLVSFPIISSVGASSMMWSQTYGGMTGKLAQSLVETSDGGYAIAGDDLLVKTDANGNMEWNQTFQDGSGAVNSLVETSDGGYAIAGSDQFIKTDAQGNIEWTKTFQNRLVSSLVETSDGGYAIAGYTIAFLYYEPFIYPDFWLAKTDSYGNKEWTQTYGGTDGDYAHSLVETSDGGYALAGWTGSFGAGKGDFWLVKTDSYGNMEWNQTYGGEAIDRAYSLIETSDGGYALAGWTGSFGAGKTDFWLVKTDIQGNMEWNQTYGEETIERAHSFIETSDGGYALAGDIGSSDMESLDVLLVKTDTHGNMEWNQTYGGTNADYAYSLVQTSDGGYALAGGTSSFGPGDANFWLIKTDAQGIPEFPSWTPLLIMLVAVAVLGVNYRRKLNTPKS